MAGGRKLTAEQINWLLNDAYYSVPIDETISKFGPDWTRRMLSDVLDQNPALKEAWEQAKQKAVPFLENDLLNVHNKRSLKTDKDKTQYSANLLKVLAARAPESYGNRIDVNMNQTVSIRQSIEKGNQRLTKLMKDVTPQDFQLIGQVKLGEDEPINQE